MGSVFLAGAGDGVADQNTAATGLAGFFCSPDEAARRAA
jgi:hypothetical protein